MEHYHISYKKNLRIQLRSELKTSPKKKILNKFNRKK